MSNISRTILSEFDWYEESSMPAANEENKKLEKQIKQKQSSLTNTQSNLTETEDYITASANHLKNMRGELQNAQGLAAARDKEIESELHLLKLTQREKGHLKQEVTNFMKEMDDLNQQNNAFESNLTVQTQKLEQHQSEMNWDQKALETWVEASVKKDEDAMTIQKYTRQDEVKIRELSHCVEKLIADALQKKHQLNVEVTNTLTNQIELDKTAENFRGAHFDREQILLQWENIIELMQKRDRQMDILSDKLAEAKKAVHRNNKIMGNKLKFLKHAQHNNIETEKKISVAERTQILLKKQLSEAEENKSQFFHETEILKRTLERSALDLELARACIIQVKIEIVEKNIKLHHAKELREALDVKLKDAVESTLSTGERATEIDDMLIAEERRQEELLLEIKVLESIMCKSQKEYNAVTAEHRIMEVSVNSSHNTIKNLASKIKRLDNHTLKQEEILYSQNLNLQQLEKRYFHMQGEQSSEDQAFLEEKCRVLLKELESLDQAHTALINHLRSLQDNRRQVQLDVNKFETEKARLMIKIDDCNLYNISLETELKNLIKKKQNMMVDQNLMKLEIKKSQDLLNYHADDILSLEMRKQQLDTALKERFQEIKVHQEMLAAKIKVEQEKQQQITAELFERMSKVDRFKMRFQYIIMSMAPPNGDGETSQVYILIKAAAEKDALQREGDNLDLRIRKAEKEIRALENTLNLMNGKNYQCKQNFQRITESSDEINKRHELQEQMRAIIDKYKYKRRQIHELHEQIKEVNSSVDKKTKDEAALQSIIISNEDQLCRLKKDFEDQREKLNRAAKQNTRYLRELRASRKLFEEVPEEKDMKLREMQIFNKNLIKMIWAAAQTSEMFQAVKLYFTEANLPLPAARDWAQICANINEQESSSSLDRTECTISTSLLDETSADVENIETSQVCHLPTDPKD